MEEQNTKKYLLSPLYKKSVCDTECWTRVIDNKTVTISVNNVYDFFKKKRKRRNIRTR